MFIPGLVVAAGLMVACSSTESSSASDATVGTIGAEGGQLHPEVLDAVFTLADDQTYDIAVTLSSPYDSPERYADAWRVTSIGGTTIFGVRELSHDHANEQPFTRSQVGIEIPVGETVVLVQGRDQLNGWGEPKEFELP